jgi:type II secretory pathway pseudopilin PulG
LPDHRTTTAAAAAAQRGAFTLVEAVVCTLVVAVLFLVAVQAVGLSATMQHRAAERARGRALAWALLDEVVQQKYAATSTVPVAYDLVFGDKAANPSGRAGFDDVDDYAGYSEKPPMNRDGTSIKGVSEYRRQVEVVLVDPRNPSQPAGTDEGLKRVTVTVARNGLLVARVTAMRADVP